jgi:hypothetical protein
LIDRRAFVCLAAMLAPLGCTARALDLPQDLGPDLSVFDLLPSDFALQTHATCPAGTNFIFTIDESTMLSRFNPTTAQFFDAGPIICPAQPGAEIDSMGVDREGNAWVIYTSGELFRLLTDSLACTATPFSGLTNPVYSGMSFSEDTPGSTSETLYVSPSTNNEIELVKIDLTTFKATNLAPLQGPQPGPELTGDDQGNLWAFFPSEATIPFIARVNKSTGALDRKIELEALQGSPGGFGMAGYQGDFYLFFELENGLSPTGPSTNVYRVDGQTGQLSTLLTNTGRNIVGVGAATCAGDGLDGLE